MNLGTGIAIAGIWLGGAITIGHLANPWAIAALVLIQSLYTAAFSARR